MSQFRRILRRLFASPTPSIFMKENPAYAAYAIGDWTYGHPRVLDWGEGAKLEIGRFCSIADEVIIALGGEHRTDWVTTFPFSEFFPAAKHFRGHPRTKGDVRIGNDVWIGWGAMILSGVTIGDGAVIGARSVVTGNVAPYSIVAGNPAKHLKDRFTPERILALQQLRWWDWPLARIQEAWTDLLAPDLDHFLEKYGGQGGE